MGYDHAELKEIKEDDLVPSSSSGSGDSSQDEIKIEKSAGWNEDRRRDTVETVSDEEPEEADEAGKSLPLKKAHTHTLGKLRFRADDDNDPTDWWFASTAIPLIAATFSPMANLLSIAALVVYWRNDVISPNQPLVAQSTSVGIADPHWCIALNIASLVCGFVGNLFLLFNFTKRVRYIVALPTTIVLFYFSSGILIGITASMNIYVPPGPDQVYSQGFWHAIIAACLYMFNSMILMINMWGYFLGHYPQHFTLTDEQRNLILQTMMFFLWLGGGAAVFTRVEGWDYPDALYFCDVTLLTIGFGDYYPTDNLGRGLVFPFSVGGTIILGLMVSSIHKFAGELSKDKVFRKHVENNRVNTLSRAATTTDEDARREKLENQTDWRPGHRPSISSPLPSPSPKDPNDRKIAFGDPPEKDTEQRRPSEEEGPSPHQFLNSKFHKSGIHRTLRVLIAPVRQLKKVTTKQQKAINMKEEKDRFDAMRSIQQNASTFKKWYALTLSVFAFGVLWCVGAIVFWQAEKHTQGLSYFQALYFCYVSLLTIGYGDLSPRSNAGKPFFVLWSLIAVPTMTILISDMGDTVISAFKRGTFKIADFTVLPKDGLYRDFMDANPWLYKWLQRRANKKRIAKGLPVGPQPDDDPFPKRTVEQLANERLTEHQLTRKLAFAIRKTADDLSHHQAKRYSYEEWVEFTRLIRFTKMDMKTLEQDEEQEGVVEWDWLDENSPMLSEQSETEWILDRLCESLLRLMKKNNLGAEPDSAATTLPGGFVPFSFDGTRRHRDNDDLMLDPTSQIGPDGKPVTKAENPEEIPPSKSQQRRQRATGADAMLTFFTGERKGTQAYAKASPVWSKKAIERMDERRRSSTGAKVRQGPFAKLAHGGKTGAIGGGRGGAGTRTLKARELYGSVDRRFL